MSAFSGEQAAALAVAALEDTLAAAVATPHTEVVLALDGEPGPWLPPGVPVIAQRGDGLDERIVGALSDAWTPGQPILLIGMDTPQVTPALLGRCLKTLAGTDVVLGHAEDGGWWALGLHTPDAALVLGVPMSAADTGAVQEQRIRDSGLRLELLPTLLDVDEPADARAVAALAPRTRFAATLAALSETVPL